MDPSVIISKEFDLARRDSMRSMEETGTKWSLMEFHQIALRRNGTIFGRKRESFLKNKTTGTG
jgi:hypothetical protein